MTPSQQALEKLKAGNQRFINCTMEHPNLSQERRELTAIKGQTPFASILSCADSRVCVENIFDQGIGDLFVVRVAGNVASTNEAASFEFSIDKLSTPLCVVMGHTHCGAVNAAVDNVNVEGNLPSLLLQIKTAVHHCRSQDPELTGENFANKAVEANVFESMKRLISISPIIQKYIKNGALEVVGAVFDIKTGEVKWLGNHPDEQKLIAV